MFIITRPTTELLDKVLVDAETDHSNTSQWHDLKSKSVLKS